MVEFDNSFSIHFQKLFNYLKVSRDLQNDKFEKPTGNFSFVLEQKIKCKLYNTKNQK